MSRSARSCARHVDDPKGCFKSRGKLSESLFIHEGVDYCLAHLPQERRETMWVACTHALASKGLPCNLCGKPDWDS